MQREKVYEYDCKDTDEYIEDNQMTANQSNSIQQSVRKKNFLRTMIGEKDNSENDDTILSRLVHICINDDTDSVEIELSISYEEDYRKPLMEMTQCQRQKKKFF